MSTLVPNNTGNELSQIDPNTTTGPCVVYTDIPFLTRFVRFIGHVAVTNYDRTKIYEMRAWPLMSSNNSIWILEGCQDITRPILFGKPSKYYLLNIPLEAKDAYDIALEEAAIKWRYRSHNGIASNCHSFICEVLNVMHQKMGGVGSPYTFLGLGYQIYMHGIPIPSNVTSYSFLGRIGADIRKTWGAMVECVIGINRSVQHDARRQFNRIEHQTTMGIASAFLEPFFQMQYLPGKLYSPTTAGLFNARTMYKSRHCIRTDITSSLTSSTSSLSSASSHSHGSLSPENRQEMITHSSPQHPRYSSVSGHITHKKDISTTTTTTTTMVNTSNCAVIENTNNQRCQQCINSDYCNHMLSPSSSQEVKNILSPIANSLIINLLTNPCSTTLHGVSHDLHHLHGSDMLSPPYPSGHRTSYSSRELSSSQHSLSTSLRSVTYRDDVHCFALTPVTYTSSKTGSSQTVLSTTSSQLSLPRSHRGERNKSHRAIHKTGKRKGPRSTQESRQLKKASHSLGRKGTGLRLKHLAVLRVGDTWGAGESSAQVWWVNPKGSYKERPLSSSSLSSAHINRLSSSTSTTLFSYPFHQIALPVDENNDNEDGPRVTTTTKTTTTTTTTRVALHANAPQHHAARGYPSAPTISAIKPSHNMNGTSAKPQTVIFPRPSTSASSQLSPPAPQLFPYRPMDHDNTNHDNTSTTSSLFTMNGYSYNSPAFSHSMERVAEDESCSVPYITRDRSGSLPDVPSTPLSSTHYSFVSPMAIPSPPPAALRPSSASPLLLPFSRGQQHPITSLLIGSDPSSNSSSPAMSTLLPFPTVASLSPRASGTSSETSISSESVAPGGCRTPTLSVSSEIMLCSETEATQLKVSTRDYQQRQQLHASSMESEWESTTDNTTRRTTAPSPMALAERPSTIYEEHDDNHNRDIFSPLHVTGDSSQDIPLCQPLPISSLPCPPSDTSLRSTLSFNTEDYRHPARHDSFFAPSPSQPQPSLIETPSTLENGAYTPQSIYSKYTNHHRLYNGNHNESNLYENSEYQQQDGHRQDHRNNSHHHHHHHHHDNNMRLSNHNPNYNQNRSDHRHPRGKGGNYQNESRHHENQHYPRTQNDKTPPLTPPHSQWVYLGSRIAARGPFRSLYQLMWNMAHPVYRYDRLYSWLKSFLCWKHNSGQAQNSEKRQKHHASSYSNIHRSTTTSSSSSSSSSLLSGLPTFPTAGTMLTSLSQATFSLVSSTYPGAHQVMCQQQEDERNAIIAAHQNDTIPRESYPPRQSRQEKRYNKGLDEVITTPKFRNNSNKLDKLRSNTSNISQYNNKSNSNNNDNNNINITAPGEIKRTLSTIPEQQEHDNTSKYGDNNNHTHQKPRNHHQNGTRSRRNRNNSAESYMGNNRIHNQDVFDPESFYQTERFSYLVQHLEYVHKQAYANAGASDGRYKQRPENRRRNHDTGETNDDKDHGTSIWDDKTHIGPQTRIEGVTAFTYRPLDLATQVWQELCSYLPHLNPFNLCFK